MTSKRILTGDRPTGRLHLGHLVGSLLNRVRLQNEYDTILLVADLHMLTTKPTKSDIETIAENTRGLVLDYLAAGIDPEKTSIYLQSAIPEVYELNTIFQNLATVNRLARLPSLKEMAHNAGLADESMPYGLLGYPVLQAADILLPKADLVPVGKDNQAHVEIAREIARRFNQLYGEVFPEPDFMLGETPTLVGTDGKGKMSKSAGNAIMLSDDAKMVDKRVRGMFTDPKRIHADIPGTVEGNPVFAYHDVFNPDAAEVDDLKERYRKGTVGDGEVKDKLIAALNAFLEPIRERMAFYQARPGLCDEILMDGTERMRAIAHRTMRDVRKAMGLDRTLTRMRRAAEKRSKKQDKTVAAALEADGWTLEPVARAPEQPQLAAVRDGLVRFVAVRGIARLSPETQDRLTHTAAGWLRANRPADASSARLDVALIDEEGAIRWVEQALDADHQAALTKALG
ncbi:MAG: tryptophan--tRNA ligase [Deltaproteobacteria bacterium]|jgi:tryptophanyl-tRNA synthetase|nr:tryptophan--tRNA ligase [Deltaproteobacteria bacterium]MBW2532005.1 tryptophan--tRNA ligase [Deltaproteobacteria bacterium]